MKRIVAAVVIALALAGCAVTGQPANPGTAATFDGRTVTNEDVSRWVTAFNDLNVAVDPSAVLTLLLLQPTIEESASDAGILFVKDDLTFEARKWIASQRGDQADVTDDMRDVVRLVRTVVILLNGADTAGGLAEAIQRIEAEAVVSPMYGKFTMEQYVESLQTAFAREQNEASLADVSYLVFKDVSGFTPTAEQPWMTSETSSPEPAVG